MIEIAPVGVVAIEPHPSDLPPAETTSVMVDVAGQGLIKVALEHAGRLQSLEDSRDRFSAEGFQEVRREAHAEAASKLDAIAGHLSQHLERIDRTAAEEISRYHAASYSVPPDVELVARQRWQDAQTAGPEAVAHLLNGVIAAGDATGVRLLLRMAETWIRSATIERDSEAYQRAQTIAPLVAELAEGLKPPAVHRAEAARIAAAEALQRARVLRASLGV